MRFSANPSDRIRESQSGAEPRCPGVLLHDRSVPRKPRLLGGELHFITALFRLS